MKTSSHRWVAVLLIWVVGLTLLSPYQAHSQDTTGLKIESDDPTIHRAGTWTNQTASGASGGSYLYSSGSESDVLTLAFNGPSIEVVYVAGPSLGTLVINVDDTVLRTVITTAERTAYLQSSQINYLSHEAHTLKIYAQAGGVIAVDAFWVGQGEVVMTGNQPRTLSCAPRNVIHRVSLTSTGAQATGVSNQPAISGDGRYVTFGTTAALVPADVDAFSDVYLFDRQTCTVELISVSSGGVKGNAASATADISTDGRYVLFISAADNLVSGDTNSIQDLFVRDRQTSTTTRESVATGGTQAGFGLGNAPVISANGRYVAFDSPVSSLVSGDTNAFSDVFVHDRNTNTTIRVSVATGGAQAVGGDSYYPAISSDGRYIAFRSFAGNLVAGDTNSLADIFVYDQTLATTTRISVATGGTQATGGVAFKPWLSADGRYVAFDSAATNLVAGDTNGQTDIFVHDRNTTTTTRVSVATGGTQAGIGGSANPRISSDGRYVVFQSSASNLVSGDTNGQGDVFLHDRNTTTTTRPNVSATGGEADAAGRIPYISADNRYVTFESAATNLVSGDTNANFDIFVTPLTRPATTLALFRSSLSAGSFINTLQDLPPAGSYDSYTLVPPGGATGAWVMGDWDGDGNDSPGVYASNGVFYVTNGSGAAGSTWVATWIGLLGRPPVAGRFDAAVNHDCIGAVDSANFPPYGTAFALYFTCNLAGGAPALTLQWLSVVLPDSSGATGTHQFAAGDFDGNGVASIAIRRGTLVAWTNIPPTTLLSEFSLAQYWGVPPVTGNEEGVFVVGDFQPDGISSFGVMYQNGNFYYRNDLAWNSGVYSLQRVGAPIGTPITATTWR